MPDHAYVRIHAIHKQLKAAEAKGCPLYIHGVVGSGKTAAVDDYFRKRKVYRLSGLTGKLDKLTPVQDIKESAIVIDDLSWITDVPSWQYICALVEDASKQLVLIGRGKVPRWLSEVYLAGKLMTADEKYLLMHPEHILQLSRQMGVIIGDQIPDEAFAQQLCEESRGFPLLAKSMLLEIRDTGIYDKNTKSRAIMSCYYYVDNASFDMWPPDMRKLLFSVADFDCFDQELAQTASQFPNTAAILAHTLEAWSFLVLESDGRFRLRFGLKPYLRWKRDLLWSGQEKQNLHKRLAVYFHERGDIPNALEQYRLAGDDNACLELLIQNSNKHPGIAYFYELRQYYLSLPEHVVLQHPSLMSGLSMLYSLILQPEKSEEWYNRLIQYAQEEAISPSDRKIAQSHIAYLDIALPHRGVEDMEDALEKVSALVEDKIIELPVSAVTSNLPSAMNGGKDFTVWCTQNKELAESLKAPVKLALGNCGLWFLNVALAESAFETATEDDNEIITQVQSGIFLAEQHGMVDIAFAGIGVLTRLYLSCRQPEQALRLLDGIEQKAREEHKLRLLPNISALRIRIALLKNDTDTVKAWVENEPSENAAFFTPNRYRYLTKLRCYIALEEYEKAWSLSNKLDLYFTRYDRQYMRIENTLLRAIVAYRTDNPVWRELFSSALEQARAHQFVRVITQEGIALKPLLRKCEFPADDEYMRRVIEKQTETACYYPRYLSQGHTLAEPLTNMEKKILSLHAEGIPTNEILDILCISERTLKFHNGNIYRKLRVKNKQEAVYIVNKFKLL